MDDERIERLALLTITSIQTSSDFAIEERIPPSARNVERRASPARDSGIDGRPGPVTA
jgi:hypothetical protein